LPFLSLQNIINIFRFINAQFFPSTNNQRIFMKVFFLHQVEY